MLRTTMMKEGSKLDKSMFGGAEFLENAHQEKVTFPFRFPPYRIQGDSTPNVTGITERGFAAR
jgi:hypothetical protein